MIILFASRMLFLDELSELPRTTKHNWKRFKDDNCYGH